MKCIAAKKWEDAQVRVIYNQLIKLSKEAGIDINAFVTRQDILQHLREESRRIMFTEAEVKRLQLFYKNVKKQL